MYVIIFLTRLKHQTIALISVPGREVFIRLSGEKSRFRPDYAHLSALPGKEKNFRRAGFEPAT